MRLLCHWYPSYPIKSTEMDVWSYSASRSNFPLVKAGAPSIAAICISHRLSWLWPVVMARLEPKVAMFVSSNKLASLLPKQSTQDRAVLSEMLVASLSFLVQG